MTLRERLKQLEDAYQQLERAVQHASRSELKEAQLELAALEKRLSLRDDETKADGEEPDASVAAPLLPRTPVLAGGNARRLEEAVEESEGESLTP